MPALFFIIEHPTRGTLKDLEETESGRVGRWSRSGNRADDETAMQFVTYQQAYAALDQVTPAHLRKVAQVRCSYFDPKDYLNAWPKVNRDGTVLRNNGRGSLTSTVVKGITPDEGKTVAVLTKASPTYFIVTAQPLHDDGSVGFEDRDQLSEDSTSIQTAMNYMANRIADLPQYDAWDITVEVKR